MGKLICKFHPSEGLVEVCPACVNGNPPDLGIVAQDIMGVGEVLNGQNLPKD